MTPVLSSGQNQSFNRVSLYCGQFYLSGVKLNFHDDVHDKASDLFIHKENNFYSEEKKMN